jgi:hypothetical protein
MDRLRLRVHNVHSVQLVHACGVRRRLPEEVKQAPIM